MQATAADVEECLARGPDPNDGDPKGTWPVVWLEASWTGEKPNMPEFAKILMAAGMDITIKSSVTGETPVNVIRRLEGEGSRLLSLYSAS